jgi:hypothetical protein
MLLTNASCLLIAKGTSSTDLSVLLHPFTLVCLTCGPRACFAFAVVVTICLALAAVLALVVIVGWTIARSMHLGAGRLVAEWFRLRSGRLFPPLAREIRLSGAFLANAIVECRSFWPSVSSFRTRRV